VTTAKAELNLPLILTVAALAVVLLAVDTVSLQAWFHYQVGREHVRKVVEPPVQALLDHQAEQQALLDRHEWIDREGGVVRLPIERAMALVVEEAAEEKH